MNDLQGKKIFNSNMNDIQEEAKDKNLLNLVKKEYNNNQKSNIFKNIFDQKKKRIKSILIAEAKKGNKEVILYPEIFENKSIPEETVKVNIIDWLQKEGFKIKNIDKLVYIKGW